MVKYISLPIRGIKGAAEEAASEELCFVRKWTEIIKQKAKNSKEKMPQKLRDLRTIISDVKRGLYWGSLDPVANLKR